MLSVLKVSEARYVLMIKARWKIPDREEVVLENKKLTARLAQWLSLYLTFWSRAVGSICVRNKYSLLLGMAYLNIVA